ncbi:oligogalacturonate lyase family protein [Paenibacillus campi]|uniref:oligogalacturonate lyase family protein n=1 Tax=Paenibacillus campi TaxID=3106031 RepID=UPI002B001797|nr:MULTISPECIES: oligogalacturonate lyase family protein [unclassified Paenibacillus]
MSRTIAMVKGTIWAPEWKSYNDRHTGIRVHQLTDYRGHSRLPYFTEKSLYDGGKRLLFISDRDNSANLFSIQLETGEMTQLTTYTGNDDLDVALTPDEQYAIVSDGNIVRALHLTHFRERIKFRCPPDHVLSNITCTADGQSILVCVCEDLSGQIDTDLGNGYVGHEQWMEAKPLSRIMQINLNTGQAREMYREHRFITHLNASPRLPWLATFCQEGPWHLVEQRIWGIDLRDGRVWRIRPRLMAGESVGHECFLPDGERIGYHGIRADGSSFFGRIRYDNTSMEEWEMPFATWHLYQNEQLVVADGQGEMDRLTLWRRQLDAADNVTVAYTEPYTVCELRCSFHSQKLHAHPRLSEDGRKLFFNSDRNGYGNLYMVELPEDVATLPRWES